MKAIELVLTDNPQYNGVDTISIVGEPAIEEDFIALKRWQQESLKDAATPRLTKPIELSVQDNERKLLIGPALVPNKPIYRNDEEEYYIYFSKETIRAASQLFLQKGHQNSSSLEHDQRLKGLSVVESWIVEDEEKDKSLLYGMKPKVGTWMLSVKVDNDKVWEEQVKTGKVKGFSIEGYFVDKHKLSAVKQPQKAKVARILRR